MVENISAPALTRAIIEVLLRVDAVEAERVLPELAPEPEPEPEAEPQPERVPVEVVPAPAPAAWAEPEVDAARRAKALTSALHSSIRF